MCLDIQLYKGHRLTDGLKAYTSHIHTSIYHGKEAPTRSGTSTFKQWQVPMCLYKFGERKAQKHIPWRETQCSKVSDPVAMTLLSILERRSTSKPGTCLGWCSLNSIHSLWHCHAALRQWSRGHVHRQPSTFATNRRYLYFPKERQETRAMQNVFSVCKPRNS